MLSDSIREHRRRNSMSQDELAEKLGVSRQSVSLWENGQTQPTIENIIALSGIFHVTTDELLGNKDSADTGARLVAEETPTRSRKTSSRTWIVLCGAAALSAVLMIVGILGFLRAENRGDDSSAGDDPIRPAQATVGEDVVTDAKKPTTVARTTNPSNVTPSTAPQNTIGTTAPATSTVDLFALCKEFAIKNGHVNGDYTIYQQPAAQYGGYTNEYFSITYWGDTDKVEFCLHCPLDETYSVNFYLRMRGKFNGKYEYLSSRYYRDTGKSRRSASGYIDPAVFTDAYPLNCDEYTGGADGQNEFMEESREGICDLIRCLKQFVSVENMGCDFSDFGFAHF